jgi:hypothetical protein
LNIKYEYPELETLEEPYIVIAPRGKSVYTELFQTIIDDSSMKVVAVGAPGDAEDLFGENLIDKTTYVDSLNLLETVSWLSKAETFFGLLSVNLVLANGFPNLKKIAFHNVNSKNFKHLVQSDNNVYLKNPTKDYVLEHVI